MRDVPRAHDIASPYGTRTFHIDFDFVKHRLTVQTSDGGTAGFALEPQSVAAFHTRLMDELGKLDLHVKIHGKPNEVAEPIPYPVFYSCAYPEPAIFPEAAVKPAEVFHSPELREFILPYDVVRRSKSPDDTLLDFLQTTNEGAASLSKRDRDSLECDPDSRRAM